MTHYDLTQMELAKKSHVSQRSISNILRPGSETMGPNLETVAKLAAFFGLSPWQMLIPNMPVELLLSKSVEKLVENYKEISKEGRDYLGYVAEAEATRTPSAEEKVKKTA